MLESMVRAAECDEIAELVASALAYGPEVMHFQPAFLIAACAVGQSECAAPLIA